MYESVLSVAGEMSAYENFVGGKLKLKGKALDVKAGGVSKKKKNKHKDKYHRDDANGGDEGDISNITKTDEPTGCEISQGFL